ncbi:MAG: hypothetical protein IJ301_03185 [Clostridia bacterium]|nr:hypothetical protein [Clostridia bacterium]
MKIAEFDYKIIDDDAQIMSKISEPLDLKNDVFEIAEKDIKKCGQALKNLGNYPSVERVRSVIERHEFTDPMEIRDMLLERYLNHSDNNCAFGTRLCSLFCVAYNYIGEDLSDREQMPLIWDAVERANRSFEFEFGGKLSQFDLDKFIDLAAEKNEAYVLSKLMGIDYERAKAIVEEDDRLSSSYQSLKHSVNSYVQEQVEIWIDDLVDHYEHRLIQEVNKLRKELGLDLVKGCESEIQDESEDNLLELFNKNLQKRIEDNQEMQH